MAGAADGALNLEIISFFLRRSSSACARAAASACCCCVMRSGTCGCCGAYNNKRHELTYCTISKSRILCLGGVEGVTGGLGFAVTVIEGIFGPSREVSGS